MKNRIWKLFLLTAAASVLLCAVKPRAYKIKGRVENAEDGAIVYLHPVDDPSAVIDSAVVKGGKFNISGQVTVPVAAYLSIPYTSYNHIVFLEKGSIQVTGNTQDQAAAIAKGTVSNNAYARFTEWYNGRSRKSYDPDFFTEEIRYRREFIDANTDNMAGIFFLYIDILHAIDSMDTESYLRRIKPELLATALGVEITEQATLRKKSAAGMPYMDFEFNDRHGNPVRLSGIIESGDYTLLNFWASWSPPCRTVLPGLREAYDRYSDRGFQIVGISVERDAEQWTNALDDLQLPWPNLIDPAGWDGESTRNYSVRAIPANILISPDGIIIERNIDVDELPVLLEDLLDR